MVPYVEASGKLGTLSKEHFSFPCFLHAKPRFLAKASFFLVLSQIFDVVKVDIAVRRFCLNN